MVLVDSLVLQQPDSLESFLPLRTQAFSAAGEILIETGTAILQFAPDGRLRRVLGRSGSGPGEFVRISTIVVLPGDSMVAAVDARRGRIAVFGLGDGQLRREVPITPFFPTQQWRIVSDTVVFASKLSPTPFVSWAVPTDQFRSWGAAPSMFAKSLAAYSQGGEPSLAPHARGWVALLPADPALSLFDSAGALAGRVTLPARRRMGVPDDLAEQVARIAKSGNFRYAASLAMAIQQRPDGSYLAVHLDPDVSLDSAAYRPDGSAGIEYREMRYWVSLLSKDLTRACLDGRVPVPADNMVVPFFRGDSLYFVLRRLGSGGRLRTVLYRYHVTDRGCDWMPLRVASATR